MLFKIDALNISQNSQENNCSGVSFFRNAAGQRLATLLKRDSGTSIFL